MSAPVLQTRIKSTETHQRFFWYKEEFVTMMASGPETVRAWVSNNLRTRLSAKVFRGVALGVLLVAGTTLYISMIQSGEGSPSVSGKTTLASQAPVYIGTDDPEVAEAPYDELSKNFIGIPALSNEPVSMNHAAVLPAWLEEDPAERVYDEMRLSFVGIPYKD